MHLNLHEKSAIFRQHTFNRIKHGYPFNLYVLQYFATVCLISMISTNLVGVS